MKFEERLMVLRKEKGWSQEDLSNKIGVSRQTISKWESAQTTPELNKLVELSKIFEISIDELVDNVKDVKNKDVSTKINLKPTYILMGIIVLLILIFFIFNIIFIKNNGNKEKIYTKSVLMLVYEDKLSESIEAMEIYSFDKHEKCLGTSVRIIVNNDEDCQKIINELSNIEIDIKNVKINGSVITYSTQRYFGHYKNYIIEQKESSLKDFQNVEIIEM